ncbi:MAG: helix-turn-helix domain-containing protein [bacterium]
MRERLYTTVDLAKVCNVSLRTIIRWVDEGRLASFRTPGGHRRVREEDLRDFLDRYRIPFSSDLRAQPQKILIAGPRGDLPKDELDALERIFRQVLRRASDAYQVCVTEGLFEASVRAGLVQPDIVILFCRKYGTSVREFCRALRNVSETRNVRILLLDGGAAASKPHSAPQGGVAVIERPPTVDKLRRHLLPLL